ncbi:hypothetical protein TUZN_0381 [Thermoproteus uzoniensis 768-20]|uniref:Uncharacterized protein n=1 Tax=Thermoproteus uzoniensis (strain 768-20) TaxID=999630 RepID=F2L2T9_THEU7|nr:hypothetical protein [Thermoproteus uzoniensis]AEA11877.1 hypothetical protein TUZN_0381 [Thermoproteus uzoniensis 768-20]
MIPWIIDIALASIASIFSLLSLRNYADLKSTHVGRYALAIAAALTAASLIALASFAFWMFRGHGPDVAMPSMAIAALLATSSIAFYKLSSI